MHSIPVKLRKGESPKGRNPFSLSGYLIYEFVAIDLHLTAAPSPWRPNSMQGGDCCPILNPSPWGARFRDLDLSEFESQLRIFVKKVEPVLWG